MIKVTYNDQDCITIKCGTQEREGWFLNDSIGHILNFIEANKDVEVHMDAQSSQAIFHWIEERLG